MKIQLNPAQVKENKLSPAQVKELKRTLSNGWNDLGYVIEFLVAELRTACVAEATIWQAVQVAAERHLWFMVSDKVFRDFGINLPEYKKAKGMKARRLVDAQAVRFSRRLAKAA